MTSPENPSLKNDHECPICGGMRIGSGAEVDGKEGLRGGNRIPIDEKLYAPLDNYVCLSCGYVESYIADRGILNRIARQWERVIPAPNDELPGAESS